MKFEKVTLSHEEHVLEVRGKTIPVSALKSMVETALFAAVIVFAFNAGQAMGLETVKMAAWMSVKGVYNPATHVWTPCVLTNESDRIVFDCRENLTLSNTNLNSTFVFPRNS